jgi:hypothetical protein
MLGVYGDLREYWRGRRRAASSPTGRPDPPLAMQRQKDAQAENWLVVDGVPRAAEEPGGPAAEPAAMTGAPAAAEGSEDPRGSPPAQAAVAADEEPRGSQAPAPAAAASEDPRGSPPAADDEEWPTWEEPAPAADVAGGAAAADSRGGPLLLVESPAGFDMAVKRARQDGATFAILVECPC